MVHFDTGKQPWSFKRAFATQSGCTKQTLIAPAMVPSSKFDTAGVIPSICGRILVSKIFKIDCYTQRGRRARPD